LELSLIWLLNTAMAEESNPAWTTSEIQTLLAQRDQAVADRDAAQKKIDELNGKLGMLGMGAVNSRIWRVSQVKVDPAFKGSEKIARILHDYGMALTFCHGSFRGTITTYASVYPVHKGDYSELSVPTSEWMLNPDGMYTNSVGGRLVSGEEANRIARCIGSSFMTADFPANPTGEEYSFTFAFELI
jgi:hypothetical protein